MDIVYCDTKVPRALSFVNTHGAVYALSVELCSFKNCSLKAFIEHPSNVRAFRNRVIN